MANIYAEYKSGRVLYLYTKLMHGEHIHKSDEAKWFEVSPRSIQRDIEDLRTFFENQAAEGLTNQELVYDKNEDCYLLRAREDLTLSNSEILAVCKILLESRALRRDEMEPIIQKLVNACISQKNRAIVQSLLANEMFHYVEPHHRK
jgi:predicted DNA-binding transcriptional regulator YafY